jgi:hypothetical protein
MRIRTSRPAYTPCLTRFLCIRIRLWVSSSTAAATIRRCRGVASRSPEELRNNTATCWTLNASVVGGVVAARANDELQTRRAL